MSKEAENPPSTTGEDKKKDDFFQDLSAETGVTEIESLCMCCHEQGLTRLLLTTIPFFKDVILMAFTCPHCGYKSNEIQSSQIQDKGVKYQLQIRNKKDLNRQVVKSDTATILIPEIQFEIPATTQKGSLNTIEGFLSKSVESLRHDQPYRKAIDENSWKQVEDFLAKLEACIGGQFAFTFVLDDPAGNSFLENPSAPSEDPNMRVTSYLRSLSQNEAIGLATSDPNGEVEKEEKKQEQPQEEEDVKSGVMTFPGSCYHCHAAGETRMVLTNIPYFKEVVLMSFACDECGYKTNEVKTGGAVSEKGKTIQFKITTSEDLARDILKSETASVTFPDIDLELGEGTLGGRFTTIEGLLVQLIDEISKNPFMRGDSSDSAQAARYQSILSSLQKFKDGEEHFTMIVNDPLANSYIQNLYAPDPDPEMQITEYVRTFDQNDYLGLNDIKTENY
eukprot:TRINITY_DN6078_c0_g1_i1.p1 TRINITY_DN6078_c0_g1~~TRINITY_DN6078_c0_g1_i1.p1  ORF type:complete len:449 (+),score=135.59 TRINITY_DN6078_c0_g1_i1:47-1393(+)